jgi:hypothetical protein
MTIEKVVGFGDSWMYGDELDDATREQDCFLGQLGQYYNVPVENYGINGSSLQSTIYTFLWWLEQEPNPSECLVLVGLTSSYRFSHYDHNRTSPNLDHIQTGPADKLVHSAWPLHNFTNEFQQLIKLQTVLACGDEWKRLNYWQTVLFFDGISARHRIPLIQFNIMPDYAVTGIKNLPTLTWPDFDLKTWMHQTHPECRLTGGHPNKQGHHLITQRLIPETNRAIITA